jgi:hypothetical protein
MVSAKDKRSLQDLCRRMAESGFHGGNIMSIMGRGILEINESYLPGLVHRCRADGSPAARLMAFWLLLEPATRSHLDELMGAEVVSTLLRLQAIEPDGEALRARLSLYPCLGSYFLADPMLIRGRPSGFSWLSPAGYAMALGTPQRLGKAALDLHPGAGIQMVLNGAHRERSFGIADREFGALEIMLNDADKRCKLVPNDSEAPKQVDLVTGTLPLAELARIKELAGRLRPGGTLALNLRHYTPDRSLLERLVEKMGGNEGWGIGVVNYHKRDLNNGSEDAKREKADDEALVGIGFTELKDALIFIRRQVDRRWWRDEVTMAFPKESFGDLIESWLASHDRFAGGLAPTDWDGWRPKWAHTGRVFVDHKWGASMVHYRYGFDKAALDANDTFLLVETDGQKTVSELAQAYATRYDRTIDAAREELGRRLPLLARKALIE